MDNLDKQILWKLDFEERVSYTEIAESLKISKQALNNRLAKLNEAGIIQSHYAVIDTHRLGLLTYRAYLRLSSVTTSAANRLIALLAAHPHALFVGSLSGVWDLEIVFVARNFIHFNELLRDLYEPFNKLVYRSNISMTPVVYAFRRDYLVGDKRKPYLTPSYGFEPSREHWDEIDYGILAALAASGRASYDEVAREVGVTNHTVKNRIIKLESAGVLRGYRPRIDIAQLGRTYYKALVACAPMSRKQLLTLYREFASYACVVYLTEVLGTWQLEVEAEVNDVAELDDIVRRVRSAYPQFVLEYDTVLVRDIHKLNYLPSGTKTRELVEGR
jgi:DNA-binding Lrp family transcriptional regulator